MKYLRFRHNRHRYILPTDHLRKSITFPNPSLPLVNYFHILQTYPDLSDTNFKVLRPVTQSQQLYFGSGSVKKIRQSADAGHQPINGSCNHTREKANINGVHAPENPISARNNLHTCSSHLLRRFHIQQCPAIYPSPLHVEFLL